jgi:hypothetical protein
MEHFFVQKTVIMAIIIMKPIFLFFFVGLCSNCVRQLQCQCGGRW